MRTMGHLENIDLEPRRKAELKHMSNFRFGQDTESLTFCYTANGRKTDIYSLENSFEVLLNLVTTHIPVFHQVPVSSPDTVLCSLLTAWVSVK